MILRNYRIQFSKAQLPKSFIYRNLAKIYNFNIKCRIPHCRKYKFTILFIHYLQSPLKFFSWGLHNQNNYKSEMKGIDYQGQHIVDSKG